MCVWWGSEDVCGGGVRVCVVGGSEGVCEAGRGAPVVQER